MAHMVVIIPSHLGIGMWALGQGHQLAGARGVRRRRGFCRSIVPERGSQRPFQGAGVSVPAAEGAPMGDAEVAGSRVLQ